MRKVLISILAVMFLAGCAGIQFQDDASQTVLYKLAGHRLGYEMTKKDPAFSAVVVKTADGIITTIETGTTTEALNGLLQLGLQKLAEKYSSDPALAGEIAIIAELVVFKGDPINLDQYKVYAAQMKAGLEGYKMGYTLAVAIAK